MMFILMKGILPSSKKMENLPKKPKVIELKVFSDDRGIFVPILDEIQRFSSMIGGIKRIYYAVNPARGVIRGFHYHEKEWKFFVVTNGTAKFVILDPNNPSEIYTFVSSKRKPNLIIIPPKYANGWTSLEDNTILVGASNLTTEESLADDKRFEPHKFGDVWTVKGR